LNYKIIAPNQCDAEHVLNQSVLRPFDPIILEFIDTISKNILQDSSYKQFPELMALAFWMRKPNILKLKETFELKAKDAAWLGRGIVFHIAPSNVDTIFVYSWFISMLVGNINIVRVSSRSTDQLEALIRQINEVAENVEFMDLKNRFMIVQYEHDSEITSYFSSLCNVRIIWGGDETIKKIRAIPVSPTTTELTFADKFSLSVIKADRFLESDQQDIHVNNFYNDAYWFNQMACSSPRLVIWLGSDANANKARELFWEKLEALVIEKNPEVIAASAVDKLAAAHCIAMTTDDILIEQTKSNLLNRILLKTPGVTNEEFHCGQGLFLEAIAKDIQGISPYLTKKVQTISVLGFDKDELKHFILENRPKGIDRIVPIGKALDFSVIWDGYDLLRSLVREIEIY
jgi:hypothetical protein